MTREVLRLPEMQRAGKRQRARLPDPPARGAVVRAVPPEGSVRRQAPGAAGATREMSAGGTERPPLPGATKDEQSVTADWTVLLEPIDGGEIAFEAGQFLTLQLRIDGELVKRAYSLSSAPGDRTIRVTGSSLMMPTVSRAPPR